MTIETKYNIGDEVWLADRETKLIKCRVERIRIDVAEGVMNERYDIMNNKWCFPITMPVCMLFPTKEELLKSLQYENNKI